MPQINNGKSPPWVSGEIVTAAELNGMIDSATINPSVITDQPNFTTLTGDEYALIVDPVSGNLKKTELKNSLLAGNDIETNNITGKANNGILEIKSTGSTSYLHLFAGSNYGGTVYARGRILNLSGVTLSTGEGSVSIASGTDGMTLGSAGVLDFTAAHPRFLFADAIQLPVGTTAQRPATPVAGDTRFNSTTSKLEFYNGTAWVSSITSSSGTSTYLLYEIYQEDISATGFVSTTFTKPVGEVWEFEVIFNWWSIINSSSSFATSELFSVSVVLDGSTKWYVSNPSIKATPPRYQTTAKWTEDSSTTYTSKTVSITGQSGSWGFSAPITSGTTSMIIKKYKVLS